MDIPDENSHVNSAVPIIITHHTVKRPPKVEVSRKFVGVFSGLKRLVNNLALKAIETVETSFWAEERKVIDKGDVSSVHYALDIESDDIASDEAAIVATKIDTGDRPAAGVHLQVVKVAEPDSEPEVFTPNPVLGDDGENIVTGKLTAKRPRPKKFLPPNLRNHLEEME